MADGLTISGKATASFGICAGLAIGGTVGIFREPWTEVSDGGIILSGVVDAIPKQAKRPEIGGEISINSFSDITGLGNDNSLLGKQIFIIGGSIIIGGSAIVTISDRATTASSGLEVDGGKASAIQIYG